MINTWLNMADANLASRVKKHTLELGSSNNLDSINLAWEITQKFAPHNLMLLLILSIFVFSVTNLKSFFESFIFIIFNIMKSRAIIWLKLWMKH